ncbi:hypothetical protein [Sphingomonas sp.]|uniref:hypothetical protein n=1 Tax=Sphingomonas sp. TaxID=28214 RepID=UPI0035BC10C3
MTAHAIATDPSSLRITSRLTIPWPTALFGVALVLGIAARVQFGRTMPLWFDETFTATIATQPTIAGLVRWCLTEMTGPGFYGSMWLWAKCFGASDLALRMPSLLLSIGAPLLIALRGHKDRRVRLFWASLALLWLPSLLFANDARPYAQLFFLASVQAIAFTRLIDRPTTVAALAWTSVTAFLILTHYSAIPIGACQGLAYLLLHRRAAVATWPALVPFVPVGVWMGYHVSFMLGMTMGPGSASPSITPSQLLSAPGMIFGLQAVGVILIGVMLATAFVPRFRQQGIRLGSTADLALASTGLAAVTGVLVLATMHLGFAPRYLMPIMPSLLFGVALWARWSVHADGRPVFAVFAVLAAPMVTLLYTSSTSGAVDARHLFSFERASAWLMERKPQRLVFLWTDEMGDRSGDRNVADIAGFSFRRRGQPVAVTVVHRLPGQDTSVRARAAAGADPRTAILWIANDRDRADRTIPRVAQQDASWTCREFGEQALTVTACQR